MTLLPRRLALFQRFVLLSKGETGGRNRFAFWNHHAHLSRPYQTAVFYIAYTKFKRTLLLKEALFLLIYYVYFWLPDVPDRKSKFLYLAYLVIQYQAQKAKNIRRCVLSAGR